MTTIAAIVSENPSDGKLKWKYDQVTCNKQPKEGELLIRMVAAGICHTDIFVSSVPENGMPGLIYPKIFGHEGAGEVEAVGPGVTVAKVGDKVLLSADYCGDCDLCKQGKRTYCENFIMNTTGEPALFKGTDGREISGKFFGQSSFAALSVVSERSVVNVQDLIQTPEELKRCAPLGCGLMTGSGAVLKEILPNDILVVVGIGAVGAGAIMTAKIVGCKAIVAVDRYDSRLNIAKELGATHVYNAANGTDFAADIQALVNGQRIAYALDTTGVPDLMQKCLKTVGKRGKLIQVGVPPLDASITIPLADFFMQTKVFEVNYLGDADSRELVPKMIQWYKEGKFPIDKIIKFYRAEDVETALEDMKEGVIKPILKF